MGVPIIFMGKNCHEQFEIIGLDRYTIPKEKLVAGNSSLNSESIYTKIFIKKRLCQCKSSRLKSRFGIL